MNIEVKNSVKPVDYAKSMKILEQRVQDVLLDKKDEFLWIIEHTHVYTAGTSSKEIDLLDENLNVIKTNRGGKHTYHGPGQKVVYFVLNLKERGKDIRKLIRYIEKCIIQILKEYEIKSFNDKKNIGIWVNVNGTEKKIAAIGIRVKRWIAFHGFSINISNNLEVYNNIIPCGIYNKGITNLCSVKKNNYKYINQKIINNFLRVFK